MCIGKRENEQFLGCDFLPNSTLCAKLTLLFLSAGNIYGSAAISHTDVSPDQFLWIDGMFKVRVCLIYWVLVLFLNHRITIELIHY